MQFDLLTSMSVSCQNSAALTLLRVLAFASDMVIVL